MPSRIAASATRLPILPRPTTPSVWPGSSDPANCFLPSSTASSRFSFFSCLTKSSAGARLRAAMRMPAITSSFTALALAPGALNTGTPRFDRAATGMLLTPAPARPTARSDGPNSNLCRSAERTRIACGSFASLTSEYDSAGKRFSPTCAIWLMIRISHFFGRALTMAGFELFHVAHQPLHAFERHRVVDRCAHTAHRAVALQLHHAALLGAFQELLVQGGIGERERHVHARAVLFGDGVREEPGGVEKIVKQPGLRDVLLLHRRQAALLLEPFEHQAGDVQRIGGGRIEHGICVRLQLVVHDARRALGRAAEQVLAHDDEGEAGRPGVLLRTGVDQREFRYVHGPGQKVRRHIRYQGNGAVGGNRVKLDSADRLVRAVMDVSRVGTH